MLTDDTLARSIEGHRHKYVARQEKTDGKRQSRTLAFWSQLKEIVEQYRSTGIGTRSVFYQAETAGIVEKNDTGYRRIQTALVAMRRAGYLDYDLIRDSSRARTRPFCVETFADAADRVEENYRYDYWADQPRWIEVWIEKEGLTPIMERVTQAYGIHLAALKGFESESFMHESAKALRRIGKPITILYLGDHDPGGWEIARTLETDLQRFKVEAEVVQLAVLPWQIEAFKLPTRLGKEKDSRLPEFRRVFESDRCVEVDAIPPPVLTRIVKEAIEARIDWAAWARSEAIEEAQRETTQSVMSVWRRLAPGTLLTLKGDAA